MVLESYTCSWLGAMLEQFGWVAATSCRRGVTMTQLGQGDLMCKTLVLQLRQLVFGCVSKDQCVGRILFLSVLVKMSFTVCVLFFPWVHGLVSVSAVSEVRVHVMFLSATTSKKTFPSTFFRSSDRCFVDSVDWQTENMTWQTKSPVS